MALVGAVAPHKFRSPQREQLLRGARQLLHLIAETAQHAGHADILRESLDGALGPPVDLLIRTGGERRLSDFLKSASVSRPWPSAI